MSETNNLESGIYSDNPDDSMKYIKSCDAREIVLCRDCKHRKADDPRNIHCEIFDMWMPEEFFCADGERRTDD